MSIHDLTPIQITTLARLISAKDYAVARDTLREESCYVGGFILEVSRHETTVGKSSMVNGRTEWKRLALLLASCLNEGTLCATARRYNAGDEATKGRVQANLLDHLDNGCQSRRAPSVKVDAQVNVSAIAVAKVG